MGIIQTGGYCPMYQKQGFTLIELLVVVLIIGILSAVALPQYQVAVEKSRATEAMILLRNMRTAIESYQMATGTLPGSLSDLDITFPGVQYDTSSEQDYFFTKYFHCRDWGGCRSRNKNPDYYIYLGERGGNLNWRCCYRTGDEKAHKFCTSLYPRGTEWHGDAWWYDSGEQCIVVPA